MESWKMIVKLSMLTWGRKNEWFYRWKLSKSVGDKTVFKDISFIIHDLDRIGLIGVNGTGKTTLLDVLSGVSGFDGMSVLFLLRMTIRLATWHRILILMIARRSWIRFSSDLKGNPVDSWVWVNHAQLQWGQAGSFGTGHGRDGFSQAWEIESQAKTVLSARYSGFDSSWWIVRVQKTGPVGKFSRKPRPLASGWADQPPGHCDHWVADFFLKNLRRQFSLSPTIVIS